MGLEPLSAILLLSVLVEIVTDSIKATLSIRGKKSKMIAIVVGIITCIFTQIGLFSQLNIQIQYTILDYILTGIVISRGSHVVHDISTVLQKSKEENTD